MLRTFLVQTLRQIGQGVMIRHKKQTYKRPNNTTLYKDFHCTFCQIVRSQRGYGV